MKTQADLSVPLSDPEYEELESFLLSLEIEEAVLNMSELDGFITAIVSGPELILPSEWLPVVLGGEDSAPAIENPEDFSRLASLMMRHFNTTAATLMEEPQAFEPCFMESLVEGKSFLVVDDWCIGYMKGVMLRPEPWRNNDVDMVEILSPIPLFTTSDGWELLDMLADRHVEYLQNQVAPAARAAHAYWLARRDEFLAPEGYSLH